MFKQMIKKIKNNAKTWFLYIILACITVNIVATPLQIEMINRIASYLCLITVLMCFLYSIIFDETTIQSIIMLAFTCLAVGSLIITNSITYRNAVDVAIFLELPILMFCYDREERKRVLDIVFLVFLFATVFYFSFCFNPESYGIDITGYPFPGAYTLGYYNPNQLGLRVISCMFILLCAVAYYKDSLIRWVYVFGVVLAVAIIYLTKSRTCLVVSFVGIILFIIQGKIQIKPIIVLAAFLVPIFVALFLLEGRAIYKDWTFLGEVFDYGRNEKFEIVFKNMTVLKYLFGDVGYHMFDNDHNAFLTIFANLGAIGCCVFFGMLMHKILKVVYAPMEPYQNTAVIGMLMLILQSSMESTIFTAGSYISIPFFIIYLIANTYEKKALKGFEKRAHNLF